MPFDERDGAVEPSAPPRHKRAPRKLELRQGDFDPAMGGHGWTEHCPKCMKAKDHGWKDAANSQHSEACRARMEAELSKTERGRARIASTQQRSDRWLESSVAACVTDASAEGEIQAHPSASDDSPPKFLHVPATDVSQRPVDLPRPEASVSQRSQQEPSIVPPSSRNAAPPQGARVAHHSPEPPVEDMGEDSDGDDEYAAHGNDVPMSPSDDVWSQLIKIM